MLHHRMPGAKRTKQKGQTLLPARPNILTTSNRGDKRARVRRSIRDGRPCFSVCLPVLAVNQKHGAPCAPRGPCQCLPSLLSAAIVRELGSWGVDWSLLAAAHAHNPIVAKIEGRKHSP